MSHCVDGVHLHGSSPVLQLLEYEREHVDDAPAVDCDRLVDSMIRLFQRSQHVGVRCARYPCRLVLLYLIPFL